ncbi:hypothetical protein [Xanthomarina sp. F2636L]|uniref:hypothetical protein n=1 Tax=Xanthomarina sp. F2636L TaxID=2996018 RepID=UPI00225DD2ED|nr:hypothetical protein [Xanthomarina sp. F2636L]MCX7550720.1 hypothetical protein [Xanthomarina sp. F2636L]
MKKLNYLLTLFFALTLFVGCDTDPDNSMPVADEGGLVVDVSDSSGKVLGTPLDATDISNSAIAFDNADVELDFNSLLSLGNYSNVSRLEIVKTLNDGPEAIVGDVSTLPFNLTYDSIEEYVSGLGIDASDLRIGDVFTFKVKLYQTDGDSYYFSPSMGAFSVVVNCASNLAGNYDVTATRDDGAAVNHGIEPVIEVSPGYYKAKTTGLWGFGDIAPDQGYNFNDTCSTLTVPPQNLAQGYYSNGVNPTDDGSVLANGNLVINYEIEFGSGNRTYQNVYVKQ